MAVLLAGVLKPAYGMAPLMGWAAATTAVASCVMLVVVGRRFERERHRLRN
jgi:hypothetical protein